MTAVPAGARLTFGGILRSEWIKLVTLRSTLWCYLILVVLTVGLSALVAGLSSLDGSDPGRGPLAGEVDPTSIWLTSATIGIGFGQLVVVVLGALVITGEYGTGMIRSTFAAVPRRLPALAAKVLVFGVVTLVVAGVALAAAALLSATILTQRGADLSIGDSGVWLAVAGGVGYIALIGLLALGLGTIIRVSAGAIATALGLVLVLPGVLRLVAGLLQVDWVSNLATFLPSSAGAQLYAYEPVASVTDGIITLDGIQGLLVLLAWVVVTGAVAAVLVKRRDA